MSAAAAIKRVLERAFADFSEDSLPRAMTEDVRWTISSTKAWSGTLPTVA